MNRQEANREIIEHLTDLCKQHPDLRFFQLLDLAQVLEPAYDSTLLIPLGYKDKFYEESEDTLKRMTDRE